MKKISYVTLIIVMAISLVSCNGEKSEAGKDSGAKVEVEEKLNPVSAQSITGESKVNLVNEIKFVRNLINSTKDDGSGKRVPDPDYSFYNIAARCKVTNTTDKIITKIEVEHLYYNSNDAGENTTVKDTQKTVHDVSIKPGESLTFISAARCLVGNEGWDCKIAAVYE